ncbi:GyrI-like domain-containing protein [Puerhibacterium sp. TATVAM-FAB25]|uniref:GyrI-like domain-containing protein n=1 Tax=Puerhibacterium sp. TATVAM-FAB25 TaxID=3093699 RepID=UPI00397CEE31
MNETTERMTDDPQGEILVLEHEEQAVVGVRQVVRRDQLPAVVGRTVPIVAAALQRLGASPAGPPYARYRGAFGDTVDVEVGFPVVDALPGEALELKQVAEGEVVVEPLPAVRAAEAVHVGAYEGLEGAYDRLAAWLGRHGLEPLDQSWEFYESGPSSDPDPAAWRTRLVMPVSGPEIAAP